MTNVQEISLDRIKEPQNAMRTEIPRDDIFELANDIKKNGLISPITVRPLNGNYEVVAGHRRFLAHRYGGMPTIKCIVRELSDEEAYAIMTSENLARQDVNPVDEATHVGRLLQMFGGEIGRVAAITGRSTAWVSDRILISQMPEDLKQILKEGKIKLGVALAFNEIKDDIDRATCIQTALTHGSSVLMAQYYAAQWRAGLFGHRTTQSMPSDDLPQGEQHVIKLRCAVDGKDYPATDFVSFLVYRENAGYVHALQEHLKSESAKTELSGGGNPDSVRSGAVAPAASMNLGAGPEPVGSGI